MDYINRFLSRGGGRKRRICDNDYIFSERCRVEHGIGCSYGTKKCKILRKERDNVYYDGKYLHKLVEKSDLYRDKGPVDRIWGRYYESGIYKGNLGMCGDGILEQSEDCEFYSGEVGPTTFPLGYHCPYRMNKRECVNSCYRGCLWGPYRDKSCKSGYEDEEIFLHYCGNGIIELYDPTSNFKFREGSPSFNSVSSISALLSNKDFFQYHNSFSSICGYKDKNNKIPMYCYDGYDASWNTKGRTYLIYDNKNAIAGFPMEQCDMSQNNGKNGYGCTKECKLRCINGVVDFSRFPELPCKSCIEGYSGKYCEVSLCENGITNTHNGLCKECHPGYYGIYCNETNYNDGGKGCKIGWKGYYCNETNCDQKFGNLDMKSEDNRCVQPCKVFGYIGVYCNVTHCKSKGENKIVCHPGFDGIDCTEFRCKNGIIDMFSQNLICYPNSCITGWKGEYCDILSDEQLDKKILETAKQRFHLWVKENKKFMTIVERNKNKRLYCLDSLENIKTIPVFSYNKGDCSSIHKTPSISSGYAKTNISSEKNKDIKPSEKSTEGPRRKRRPETKAEKRQRYGLKDDNNIEDGDETMNYRELAFPKLSYETYLKNENNPSLDDEKLSYENYLSFLLIFLIILWLKFAIKVCKKLARRCILRQRSSCCCRR